MALGRAGSDNALAQLRRYRPEALASALQTLSPAERVEFLEMAERVDEIVPLLPEAEFTSTVRGAGIEESGWLVEFASSEQRVAAVDLDCWRRLRFSPSRLFEWIDAMIEAGPETLAASFYELDEDLWVLAMKAMGDFSVAGFDDATACDGMTIDGVVFYSARSAESEERIAEILGTALHYAPACYWKLVIGAISESRAESEDVALRWQRGRLCDLGFPDPEQAMQAYQPMRVDQAPDLAQRPETEPSAALASALHVPARLAGSLLGSALAALPPERASEVMEFVLAVANTLAVADGLPLAEPETVEKSLAKALRGIERGLSELSRARCQPAERLLDAMKPLDLFRIGASYDPELRPRINLEDLIEEEEGADWSVETEMISDADMTVGRDGRLKGS